MEVVDRSGTRVFVTWLSARTCRDRLRATDKGSDRATSVDDRGFLLVIWGLPPFHLVTYRVCFIALRDRTALVVTAATSRWLTVAPMLWGTFLALLLGSSRYSRADNADAPTVDRLGTFVALALLGAGCLFVLTLIGRLRLRIGDRVATALARLVEASEADHPVAELAMATAQGPSAPTSWRERPLMESVGSVVAGCAGLGVTVAIALTGEWGLTDRGLIGPIIGVVWFGLLSLVMILSGLARFRPAGDRRAHGMNVAAAVIAITAGLLLYGSLFELVFV